MQKATALEKAALELEREARRMRQEAVLSRQTTEHTTRLRKVRHGLLLKVRTLIAAGIQNPMTRLAQEHRLPAATIAQFYWQALREEKDRDRQRRDREIMRAARAGRTNAEIAARFRLHPKTVQRIVRRDLVCLFRDLDGHKDQEADHG